MIVYGDHFDRVDPATTLAEVAARIEAVAAMPDGIGRHHALISTFVLLGQLAQGITDARFEQVGADGGSPAEDAVLGACVSLGSALIASWASDFTDLPALPDIPVPDDLPAEVVLRLPEGYAYYALYPEAYAEAARRLRLVGPPRVIGIRSIGSGLAAMVAAALGAPRPITVRPTGHPFDRRVLMTPEATARLIDPAAHYVIVDEGPGLSGSSFAAVADLLTEQGVPGGRIAFLPSHAGDPGPQASERIRNRWAGTQRATITIDELIPPDRLARWAETVLGPLDGPPEDVSGGGWRAQVYADEDDWPAVIPFGERRKFLLRAGGERWLMKFAGLGPEGEAKLVRGRLLAAAGLTPEVRGLLHGFLLQRWVEGRPLDPASPDLVARLAHYLGARARLLPRPARAGASLARLFEMAEFNIRSGLGADAARRLAARHRPSAELQARSIAVAVDGRLDRAKWLRRPDGAVVKLDALDHDAGHDLIGPQDFAWDIAGATAEFNLSAEQERGLLGTIDRLAFGPVDRALLRFLTPCYLAFRFGAASLAAASLDHWPAEAARNRARAEVYAERLRNVLAA